MKKQTMLRAIMATGFFWLTLSALADAAAPLVYYNFESDFTNQGIGGAIYNATTTGSPTAGWTGGTVGSSTRPGGVTGAALSTVHTPNNYITMPAGTAALGQSFTISGWFYLSPSSSTAGQRYYPFEGSDNYDVSFGTQSAITAYGSYVGQGGYAEVSLPANEWHHVVHSFSSSGGTTSLDVYIDGVLRSTTTAPTTSMNFAGINIGNARTGQARNWDGLLDEFAAWNTSLSATEVAHVYSRGMLGKPVTGPIVSFADGTPDVDAEVNFAAVGWAGATQTPIAGVNNDLTDAGFSGQYLRTTGAGNNTLTLTYSGLDEHTHVNLGMLLAQLDSLAPQHDGDRFIVRVDGETILDAGFGYGVSVNGSNTDAIVTTGDAALDAELLALRTIADTSLYGDANFLENVYNLDSLSLFNMIPHTGDTLTLELIGRVNQSDGGWYGVDNISLQLVNTPEPASVVAFGIALCVALAGGCLLRRKPVAR